VNYSHERKEGEEAMKAKVLWVLLIFFGLWSSPAAADNRFIVRAPSGLTFLQQVLQQVCSVLVSCNVVGGLDGTLNKVFLVTTPDFLDPNAFLQILRSQPGIAHVEADALLRVMQATAAAPPSGLWDNTPVNYFGATVIHGYVSQPAIGIIRLPDSQTTFNVSGTGTVAVIDTGVDPSHPVLQSVLVPGYGFTRNSYGSASELTDVNQSSIGSGASPARVNQSSAAILDPQSVFNFNQPQYQAFGHGTMVSGIIHLVAPTALIMPLKAFNADGTGYLSDVLSAIYFAVQNGANVINMSFSFPTYSVELAKALKYATRHRVICVASAGNDGEDEVIYPAALADVMGVASTTNNDTLSSFSNYGEDLVWVAAPGEGIITTYPFGTFGAGWGTSFSAPFVSGAAALLQGVRAKCNESCAESSLANAFWISPDLGNGRVDLYQAVDAASEGRD
jgi:subtilisin family serine protease